MPSRPAGRETHVTSGGKGVHKGQQVSTGGPVGRPSQGGSAARSGMSSGSSGPSAPQGNGGRTGTYGTQAPHGSGRTGTYGTQAPHGSGRTGTYGTQAPRGNGRTGIPGTGAPRGKGGRRSGGGLIGFIIAVAVVIFAGSRLMSVFNGGSGSSGSGSSGSGLSASSTSSPAGSGYGGSSSYTGLGHGSGGYASSGGGSSGSTGGGMSSLLYSLLGSDPYDSGLYPSLPGGSSGSAYGSHETYGSDGWTTSTIPGSDSGVDLSPLADLFGAGVTNAAAGISTGWNDGRDNRGILSTEVCDGARRKYTTLLGDGMDTVTLMVYMCGTDLESRGGMGTADLAEMAAADLADNVNVLVYTGGCSSWKNQVVSSRANQIYRVHSGGLERLVDNDGDRSMTDPATLTRFIRWSAAHYPASRYQLILWDHGSGSLSGYGYDQKHQRSGSMSLTGIRNAVEDGGVKFDFIGFDACLMATVENALALSDSADYLIASEETEPGTGWYYTDWLSALSWDTSMPTTELGKQIIDDFVEVSARKARGQDTTLSLVDLAELQTTFPKAFSAFAKDTMGLLESSEYKKVSTARSSSREFASSNRIDQIDLTDMAWKLGTQEGRELSEALLGAIKYNRTSSSMCNSYGLSIYFPGSRLSKVDSMVSTYKNLGIDADYTRCIQQYAAVSASGQAASGGSTSLFDLLGSFAGTGASYGYGNQGGYGSGSGNYGSAGYGSAGTGYGSTGTGYGGYGSYGGSSLSGMGTDLLMDLVGSFLGGRSRPIQDLDESNTRFLTDSGLSTKEIVSTLRAGSLNADKLVWDTSTGLHTMHLDEEDWEQVSRLTVNMLFDDGEGFIDLGEDNTFAFTAAGDLQGETNRTWLSINSQPVAYYHISTVMEGESAMTVGRVPCLLNGERVNLIIAFDQQNPYGYIAGARYDYVDGETDTLAKAMTKLQTGDELIFLCDYYAYDGTYSASYTLGEPMTVEDVMVISNTDVGEGGALVTYHFVDLYGQSYWTEPIYE